MPSIESSIPPDQGTDLGTPGAKATEGGVPGLRPLGAERWVFLVLVQGWALRLVHLADRNTWYDEIMSILFAQADLAGMVRATAADTMPPLYYSLLHFWLQLGEGLFWARLPSVFLGVLTLALLYGVGRRLLGPQPALFGVALLALSPFHLYYSQEVRMYSLLAFLGVLTVAFFVAWWQSGRVLPWLGFTLSAAALLYVHHLAFLVLVALDIFVLLLYAGRWPRPPAFLPRLGASHLLMLVALLPWLSYLLGQVAKVERAFWIGRPGLAELAKSAIVFHFNLPALPDPPWILYLLLFWALLLATLTLHEVARAWRRNEAITPALGLLVILFLGPVLLMFLLSQLLPVYVDRGVITSSLAYYLLLGWALLQLPWLAFRVLLLQGLVLLMALSLAYYYQYDQFPRSPFREAAAYLAEQETSKDAIVHDNKLSFFPMRYFAPTLPQSFIADVPGSPNDTLAPGTMEVFGVFPMEPQEAVRNHPRVWFVLFQRALGEAQEQGRVHANKRWFDERFVLRDVVRFSDLNLYLYEAPASPGR